MDDDIFVVDDDPAVLRAVERLLAVAGYRVRVFPSARGVVEALRVRRPVCLIIDVQLPEVGGIELAEAAREVDRSVALIFISGHADVAIAVGDLPWDGAQFLPKPFDGEALLLAIAQAKPKMGS